MKTTLTLLLIACMVVSCKNKLVQKQLNINDSLKSDSIHPIQLTVKNIYHIKVCPDIMGEYGVSFTNDNWVTAEYIMDKEDGYELNYKQDSLVLLYDTKGFSDLYSATVFAKRMRKYTDCISYNIITKQRYDSINLVMQKHPKIFNRIHCCTIVKNIY